MLKKELAMHQKRAQDAIKFQREQTQRMASNLSFEASKLSGSYSESDSAHSTPDRRRQMELFLAEPPPPPPPPRTSSAREQLEVDEPRMRDPPTATSQKDHGSIPSDSSDEEDSLERKSRQGRSVLDVVESLSEPPSSKPEPPPRMYSTPNRHRKEDRWTPHIHDAPGSVEQEKSLFPNPASPKMPNYNEEFPSDIVRTSSTSSHHRRGIEMYANNDSDEDVPQRGPTLLDRHSGFITMNSIDAFEASFDTTFPTNFSASRRSSSEAKIYNPFDSSPPRNTERVEQDASPQPFSRRTDFATPKKVTSPNTEMEPLRPHKTPSTEARARYEKAMQPRSQEQSVSSTDALAPERERNGLQGSSPSKFLQRIQQGRKGKDYLQIESKPSDGSPSDSSAKQENVAPSRSPHVMPKLLTSRAEATVEDYPTVPEPNSSGEGSDRPVGMMARLTSLKNRRAVKQPVSYAEPALNTKIRQGHTYFPKEPFRTVTPEHVKSPNGT
jgi:hypothetical protein